ncbi:hypothetical protein RIVM261_075800 [Rivularia sp. IAM M-261]|nr:hypothetical protein RIVM261_075800 [Rivularia sp. IAM M-261]
MSNLKKDVDLIRKLVNQSGVKNIPHSEIIKLCEQSCDYDVEDNRITLEQRKEIANTIIKKYQITDLATNDSVNNQLEAKSDEDLLNFPNNLADNQIQPVEEAQAEEDSIRSNFPEGILPLEDLRSIEENYTPLEESNLVVSNQDKHSEITLQANQMGITLTSEQISVVASDLGNQFEDEDEFISSVKSALIAFIDYQTKQSNTKFNKMLGDVEDYAESKQHQRFENMTTNLKQFSTRLQDKNNFFRARQSSIVAALHSRIPK